MLYLHNFSYVLFSCFLLFFFCFFSDFSFIVFLFILIFFYFLIVQLFLQFIVYLFRHLHFDFSTAIKVAIIGIVPFLIGIFGKSHKWKLSNSKNFPTSKIIFISDWNAFMCLFLLLDSISLYLFLNQFRFVFGWIRENLALVWTEIIK